MRRSGITLIETIVVVAIVATIAALTVAAVQAARRAALRSQCANQLRELGLALHQYHATYKRLPAGTVHPRQPLFPGMYGPDTDPYPLSTWQMRLLPFIDQGALWSVVVEAYLKDPYAIRNPPHWPKDVPVALFLCPADSDRAPAVWANRSNPALSSYVAVSGTDWIRRDGMFYEDSQVRFTDVSDGLSNTIALGERPPSLDRIYGRWYGSWGFWGPTDSYLGARDLAYGPYLSMGKCLDGPYSFGMGRLDDPCAVFHFWSFHSGGANFLFADAGVRFVTYAAANHLPALATRAGGEPVTLVD